MKTNIFLLSLIFALLILFSTNLKSQNSISFPQEKDTSGSVFTVVEEAPKFPGGDEARINYLIKNIVYPENARNFGIQGTVYVNFIVETDGSISNVKILRGIGGGCDEETIRIIKNMPKWIPAKQRGKNVRVQFNMPIKFILEEKNVKSKKKNFLGF